MNKDQHLLDIRADLMRQGHTISSIARALGVSHQHVRRVLNGGERSARVREYVERLVGRPLFPEIPSTEPQQTASPFR